MCYLWSEIMVMMTMYDDGSRGVGCGVSCGPGWCLSNCCGYVCVSCFWLWGVHVVCNKLLSEFSGCCWLQCCWQDCNCDCTRVGAACARPLVIGTRWWCGRDHRWGCPLIVVLDGWWWCDWNICWGRPQVVVHGVRVLRCCWCAR